MSFQVLNFLTQPCRGIVTCSKNAYIEIEINEEYSDSPTKALFNIFRKNTYEIQ